MTSSPVTPVDNENMASLIKWDDEEGELQEKKNSSNEDESILDSTNPVKIK